MRRLHPIPATDLPSLTDVYAAYRPTDPAAPLMRINMVSSADGHIADAEGVSGGIGGVGGDDDGSGDLMAFRAMRHLADAILVGAGTVRAEDYGPMRINAELRDARVADGRVDPAPVVVVTSSGDLDVGGRLFSGPVAPVVLTSEACPMRRRDTLVGAGATVMVVGQDHVDLGEGVRRLQHELGLDHILCEGGPSLNAQMFTAGLVDELCLTMVPALAGGESAKRIVDGLSSRQDLELTAVLEHEGELLLRYHVPRARP